MCWSLDLFPSVPQTLFLSLSLSPPPSLHFFLLFCKQNYSLRSPLFTRLEPGRLAVPRCVSSPECWAGLPFFSLFLLYCFQDHCVLQDFKILKIYIFGKSKQILSDCVPEKDIKTKTCNFFPTNTIISLNKVILLTQKRASFIISKQTEFPYTEYI